MGQHSLFVASVVLLAVPRIVAADDSQPKAGDGYVIRIGDGQEAKSDANAIRPKRIEFEIGSDAQVADDAKRENMQRLYREAIRQARAALDEREDLAPLKAEVRKQLQAQRELIGRAWQTYRNIEALGNDNPAETKRFWDELAQIESELQATFKGGANPPGPTPAVRKIEPPVFNYRVIRPGEAVPDVAGTPRPEIRLRAARDEEQQLRMEIERLRREIADVRAYLKSSSGQK